MWTLARWTPATTKSHLPQAPTSRKLPEPHRAP
jgi:hypothetical protein